MEKSVKQRIREFFIDEKKISERAFSEVLGIGQKTFNKQMKEETSMPLSTILLILSNEPTISAEWLLRGVGDMYLPNNSVENSNNNAEENYLKETIELLKSNIEDLKETIAAQRETIAAQRNENALLKKETDYIQENHIVCAAHSAKPHIV